MQVGTGLRAVAGTAGAKPAGCTPGRVVVSRSRRRSGPPCLPAILRHLFPAVSGLHPSTHPRPLSPGAAQASPPPPLAFASSASAAEACLAGAERRFRPYVSAAAASSGSWLTNSYLQAGGGDGVGEPQGGVWRRSTPTGRGPQAHTAAQGE